MSPFRGYSLIQLVKAVGEASSLEDAFSYEVILHDVLGRKKVDVMTIAKVDRDWCKLRMNGNRMAVMESGVVRVIDWGEWFRLANPEET